MDGNTMVGFVDMYFVCPYCGKEFHYNGYNFESRMKALKCQTRHVSMCLVRLGVKKCPKEWKKKIEKNRNKIKDGDIVIL